MRTAGIRVVAIAVLVLAPFAAPIKVAAECDGPYPSFRETAPTARIVVIGTVINSEAPIGFGNASSRFTVQVERTLRGATDPALLVRDLPSQPCAGPIVAADGWRIALAIDGVAYQPPVAVNSVAIIEGPGPDLTGVEHLTVDEILAIVPPLQEPASADRADLLPLVGTAAIILAVVGGLVGWRLRQEA